MKVTNVCLRGHNMYRWIRRQWFAQSKKPLFNTPMEDILRRDGVRVYDAAQVIQEPDIKWMEPVKTVGVGHCRNKLDDKHPAKQDEPCFFHRDRNVLLEGLNQAKLFTNAVQIQEGLPESLVKICEETDISRFEESIQMAVASAVVYDATQEKLPKRMNPENPAWNYPRDYGITDSRRNFILCNRFLQLCEMMASSELDGDGSIRRCKLMDAFFSVPLIRGEDIIQLQMRADILVLAANSIEPLASAELTTTYRVPNLDPLKYTVSLEEEYFYQLKNIYPVKIKNTPFKYVHTALIHFNETEVKNLHGTAVTEDQIVARSLMKSFTIAAAQARSLYGSNIVELPKPIVVQCIQTDAKYFHFSIFQLNTLSWPPNNTRLRNIFWHDSMVPTYEFGGYYDARPTISSYNDDVFKMFLAFYKNSSSFVS